MSQSENLFDTAISQADDAILRVMGTRTAHLKRPDTLTILGDTFWVDRITPAGGDSSIILLGRGTPPTDNRRRTGGMFDCSPA